LAFVVFVLAFVNIAIFLYQPLDLRAIFCLSLFILWSWHFLCRQFIMKKFHL
jgi:hypothetical protein